jgi:uncharacterized protein YjbI with pentapeptide repeats
MPNIKPPGAGGEPQNEKWYERTRYQILLFASGIALFVLVGGWLLDWYIEPKTSGQKKDLVQALGLITAGVAGAVGIYFTWRGQRLTRQAQEENQRNTLEQLEQSRNELDITRRGQITGRFTQAIDQLGSESLEIRLGAIYSLERTAREDRDFHWPIMEVLTTYVRTHAPRKHGPIMEVLTTYVRTHAPRKPLEREEYTSPKPDIQAILTVIGRRSVHHTDVEYGRIDLHDTGLTGALLAEANLLEANLSGVNLLGADLSGANLSGANLSGADLSGALLTEVNLLGANLSGALLAEAKFSAANVDPANLLGANLSEANLSRANLRAANLALANLTGTNLSRANLLVANLALANLSDANLREANLSYANLSYANLTGANLLGANLSSANLSNASYLAQAHLEETVGDEYTQLPSDFKPPAHWGVKTDEQSEGV